MDWQIRLIIWQFDHLMDWSSDRWEGKPSKFGFFCQMLKTASDRDGWFWHRVVSSLYQEWSDVISQFRALTFQVTLMTILLHLVTGELVLDSDLWKSRWGEEAPKCQLSQLVLCGGVGDVVEEDFFGDVGRALGQEEDLWRAKKSPWAAFLRSIQADLETLGEEGMGRRAQWMLCRAAQLEELFSWGSSRVKKRDSSSWRTFTERGVAQ